MKKLLPVAGLILVLMSACSNSGTNETTGAATLDSTASTEAQQREKEINDSTKMLDKKLADPNSSYSPDSLK
jgi:hypothetical protein